MVGKIRGSHGKSDIPEPYGKGNRAKLSRRDKEVNKVGLRTLPSIAVPMRAKAFNISSGDRLVTKYAPTARRILNTAAKAFIKGS